MPKFEINPSRGMRVWAAVVAIVAVCCLILAHRLSSQVAGAAMLLVAWEMAFVPLLPFNQTLGEIHQQAQQGWRMSRTARVINYATFALFILAAYLKAHGR